MGKPKKYVERTPEQVRPAKTRARAVDVAIRKRMNRFDKSRRKNVKKLAKAAKICRGFEVKKLKRRLQIAKKIETGAITENDKAYENAKKYEHTSPAKIQEQLEVAKQATPEAIAKIAFKEIDELVALVPPASDQPPQKKRKLSQAEKQTILEEIEAPAPKAKKQKVDTPKSAQEKSETSSDSESDSDSDSDSESSEGEEDVVGEENEEKQETEGASVTKLLPVTEEGGAFGKFAKKIILHTQFQEAFEDIKNLVLIQKQRLELFKKQCPKHELKKDEKALENHLNPKPKGKYANKPKKNQQKKKKVYLPMTEEEKKAARKWKYDKNKERNKLRKQEADQKKRQREGEA